MWPADANNSAGEDIPLRRLPYRVIFMKDLLQLAAICKAELESIGIRCGNVRSWQVNTRSNTRWGQCRQLASGVFEISIAACLLSDDVDIQKAKDTIVHELLHTLPGCMDHSTKWKAMAQKVNRSLPGYRIQRTTSREEKGITNSQESRYLLRCSGCGRETPRNRMSPLVQHPGSYRCAVCHGELIRIK